MTSKNDALSNLNNPLNSFIDQEPTTLKAKGGRPRAEAETRSRRTNVLFTPRMFGDLKDLAAVKGTSLNNLINELAEDAINANADALEKFAEAQNRVKD